MAPPPDDYSSSDTLTAPAESFAPPPSYRSQPLPRQAEPVHQSLDYYNTYNKDFNDFSYANITRSRADSASSGGSLSTGNPELPSQPSRSRRASDAYSGTYESVLLPSNVPSVQYAYRPIPEETKALASPVVAFPSKGIDPHSFLPPPPLPKYGKKKHQDQDNENEDENGSGNLGTPFISPLHKSKLSASMNSSSTGSPLNTDDVPWIPPLRSNNSISPGHSISNSSSDNNIIPHDSSNFINTNIDAPSLPSRRKSIIKTIENEEIIPPPRLPLRSKTFNTSEIETTNQFNINDDSIKSIKRSFTTDFAAPPSLPSRKNSSNPQTLTQEQSSFIPPPSLPSRNNPPASSTQELNSSFIPPPSLPNRSGGKSPSLPNRANEKSPSFMKNDIVNEPIYKLKLKPKPKPKPNLKPKPKISINDDDNDEVSSELAMKLRKARAFENEDENEKKNINIINQFNNQNDIGIDNEINPELISKMSRIGLKSNSNLNSNSNSNDSLILTTSNSNNNKIPPPLPKKKSNSNTNIPTPKRSFTATSSSLLTQPPPPPPPRSRAHSSAGVTVKPPPPPISRSNKLQSKPILSSNSNSNSTSNLNSNINDVSITKLGNAWNEFGSHVASWAEKKLGRRVGNGNNNDLIFDSIDKGCGHYAMIPQNFNNNNNDDDENDLIYGSTIYKVHKVSSLSKLIIDIPLKTDIKRGDIIKFKNTKFENNNLSSNENIIVSVIVSFEDGDSISGDPILNTIDIVLQLNNNNDDGDGIVKRDQVDIGDLISGEVEIFRVIPKSWI